MLWVVPVLTSGIITMSLMVILFYWLLCHPKIMAKKVSRVNIVSTC